MTEIEQRSNKTSLPKRQDPCAGLVERLRDENPGAHLVYEEGLFYAARKTLSDPDSFFSGVIQSFLSESPANRAIAVHDFSLSKGAGARLLPPLNIVVPSDVEACGTRVFQNLDGEDDSRSLSRDERDGIFRNYLNRSGGERIFHFDHHYGIPALATTSTTVLLCGYLEYLRSNAQRQELSRLANAVAILDHADPDILLSHFLRRHALDDRLFENTRALQVIKDAALFNDHVVSRGPKELQEITRVFFNFCLDLEHRIEAGEAAISDAMETLPRAIEFAFRTAPLFGADGLYEMASKGTLVTDEDDKELIEHFVSGAREYMQGKERLSRMTRRGRSARGKALPGCLSRVGRALVTWVPDSEPEIPAAVVLMYLQWERPELLEGVSVFLTTSPAGPAGNEGQPREVKLRSCFREGAFLDLTEVYRALREMDDGQRYPGAGGRATAGSLSKSPCMFDIPIVVEDVLSVLPDRK